MLNLPPRAKQRAVAVPAELGRAFAILRLLSPVRHVRVLVHAATDHPKTHPRHCHRADLPDGDHVGAVDGDDAKDCPSARRAQQQICRGLRPSGADECPLAGAGAGAAADGDREDAVAARRRSLCRTPEDLRSEGAGNRSGSAGGARPDQRDHRGYLDRVRQRAARPDRRSDRECRTAISAAT